MADCLQVTLPVEIVRELEGEECNPAISLTDR